MELELKKSNICHLKYAIHTTQYQEESGETIVPDSYPDMLSVIHTYACPVLRGKDYRDGSAVVSGSIKGGMIYQSDDPLAGVQKLDFDLPFTVKFESPDLKESSKGICSVSIRAVDGKIINSRKAMLRVDLGCDLCAYEDAETEVFELSSCYDAIQVKQDTYTFLLPVEVSEKSFVLSENIDIPTNRPLPQKLCKCSCQVVVSDCKLVGNKGVFKGDVLCKILYISEDLHFYTWEQRFPFSQFCEFENDYDEGELSLTPVITGYQVEIDEVSGHRKAQLSLHILMQGVTYEKKKITTISDAYATIGNLVPQWKDAMIESVIDETFDRFQLQSVLKGNIAEISDVDIYFAHPLCHCDKSGTLKLSIPVNIHVVGIDQEGKLTGISEKMSHTREIPLSDSATCCAKIEQADSCYASVVQTGAEVRLELHLHNKFLSTQSIKSLCSGDILNDSENAVSPSVILKMAQSGSSLWEIAKEHRSHVSAIRELNAVCEDFLTEERMLLIPVG